MSHGAVATFFLRIVGKDPVQVEEDKRFRENLRKHQAHEDRLDTILEGIDKVNKTARKKREDLEEFCTTISGPPEPITEDGR